MKTVYTTLYTNTLVSHLKYKINISKLT